jgi:F-type H+-transporting ATPase subunit b
MRETTPVINVNATLLIQVINFVVLMLILNAILYKPIMAKMREREARIKGDLDGAKNLEQKVLDQEALHQEELTKARQTASGEKADLMAEAKKQEAGILDKARGEASVIVEEMKATIQKEAEGARATLKEEMTPLAQSVAEKILGRSL